MNRVIRRIGPLVLWQYVICVAMAPLYFLTASTVDDTWPGWLLPRGVIVSLVIAVVVWRDQIFGLLDKFVLLGPEGRAPRKTGALRVERHFGVFLVVCLASGLLAIFQSLSMVESAGMVNGFLAYLLAWHGFLVIPLAVWARNRDAERPLPPKRGTMPPGIAEFWIVPPDDEVEGGPVTVAVKVDGIRSVEAVVVAVLGRQVLPPVAGGKRRWSITVDGVAVGEVTQSWHHPRWWPPIEWRVSPSSLFKGERVVFQPVDSERA